MKPYVLSLLAGVLIGLVYSVLGVMSPAPPLIALIGLLGILVGEQIFPIAKRVFSGTKLRVAWDEEHCKQHLFGSLPGRQSGSAIHKAGVSSEEKH